MKKPNFKKLALMGITGGVALCSNASAEAVNLDNSAHLLAASCSSKQGCTSLTAYQPHSCNTQQQPQNYYNNAPIQGQPMQGQPVPPPASCSAVRPNGNGNYTAYQPHSCNASQPQGYTTVSSSCNAARPAPQAQPAYTNTNYSQWESNGKIATTNTAPVKTSEDAQVLSRLNEEGKAIYRGLDKEGQILANKLVRESDDPNQAVKIAAQRRAEQRANPNAPK